MRKGKNYVTNIDLHSEIVKYQKEGVHSEKLHLMFFKMAEQIATKACFSNYTWIEDMTSDSYLKCLEVAKKFDLERTNPFSYFTTVIHNFFLDVIAGEKKQKALKEKLRDDYNEGMYIRHGINFNRDKEK